MKKFFKALFTFATVVTLLLSMCVGAYADSELPTETVWYGCGHPEAAPVLMHGLSAENITIDGVDIELFSSDGYVYIRLVDLAAAKLLRESADKMAELGLTAEQLYIKNGLILVKEDGLTADEVSALTEKVNELTNAVQIAASAGDIFTLGNAGAAVLYVEIGGFSLPPVSDPAEQDKEFDGTRLDVCAGTKNAFYTAPPTIELPGERPEVTTLYITYGFIRIGIDRLNHDRYGTYEAFDCNDPANYAKSINDSCIYLVKAENDKNTPYYYSTNGTDYTLLDDCLDDSYKYYNILSEADISVSPDSARDAEHSDKLNNTTITISTTPDGSNVIKTIKYHDVTPQFDPEVPDNLPSTEDYRHVVRTSCDDYTPIESIKIVSDDAGTPIDEAETVTANVDNGISISYRFKETEQSGDSAIA